MTNKHLFLLLLAAFFAPLAMKAQNTLTVHDGTETSDRVPIFSWHAGASQQSQLIYPASELTAMSGKALTQMVFYWQQGPWTSDNYSVGTWTISLGETTATTFNGGFDTTTPLTDLFTGVLDEAGGLFNTTDHTLTITFDEEYAYQGGNLLVQFAHTGTGEHMDYHFIGQSMDEATSYLCCYESNGNAYNNESINFLPKTTFTYQAQPNCAKPTNLAISYNEGDPTATVTWDSEATNFNIDVNGTITAVTDNSYTFAVSLITTYTIKVQADCGDEQSFWTKAISFFSGCGIFPVTYSYGFEDANDMNCWTIITTGNNSEYTGIYEDEDDEDYAHTGSHSFRFYYTTEPGQYLISPELGGIGNGLRVKFWYREKDEYYTETFQVGYSTTDNDPDSFTWGDEITATTSYQQFKANYPAATKYVAVKHTSDNQWNLYLDDFLFEESPSCLEPTGVQVADATTHGATVSWTAGGSETAWDIYVTADATIVPDGTTTPTVANTNNNPYNLTGLSAGTVYYVYVRAICSGTEVSDWSNVATFATECEAMALPYEENFNAGMPVCWNTIFDMSNTDIVTQPKTSPTDPDKILMFQRYYDQNYAFAVLPEIDASYPLNGYQISFDACYYYFETNVKLSIGVMTDPADSTTFVPIDEVDIIDSYDYSDSGFGTYTVYFNNYTGNGRYIAIRDNNINSQGYVLIDNIVVSELPSCLSPTGLTANVASTSAELSWTANNGESSWTLYWKESGAEAYTEVPNLTENSYTLNNLSAGAAYQFCVVAHCGETDHSAPSSVYTFATNCDPVTLPWSEDFDNLAAGQGVPACWNTIVEGSGSCSIESVSGGNNVLDIFVGQSSGFSNAAVVLPKIDANYPLNQCQISFDACHWSDNGSTTPRQLLIFVLNDPTDLQSGVGFFVDSIVDITNAYPTFGSYTVQFDRYEGTGQYIALICGGNESSGPYDVLIDNIVLSEASSCLYPTGLAANAASTSAELSWTANNSETSWTLYWKEVGADEYTEVPNVTDNPYTLSNLSAATTYEFYVVAHCDENDHSAPSALYTFTTTDCNPITLPWSEDFEGLAGEGLLPACWNTISDNSSACIIGPTNINNNNVLVINMNQSSTPYSAAVVLPVVDADYPLNQCQISFDAGFWCGNSSTTEEQLIVSIMSDPNNPEAGVEVGYASITDDYSNMGRYTVLFNSYEGSGQYIALLCLNGAFFGQDSYAIFIDNIELSEASSSTDCDPITLPWSEDFNDLVGEDLPACWNTIIDGSTSCSIAPFPGDDNNGLVISINESSLQNSVTVVLPEVDASYPLNQCQISFDAGYINENTTEEQLIIVIMSDPNDSQTAEMIGFVAITDDYPHIGRHTVRFNEYEGNGQYIALVCLGGGSFGGSDSYAVFIDNIEVSPLPSCIPPANLIASNITGSSAQLAWTANGQSAWDIYVTNDATDVPDDNTTPTVANTEDNPYSLTDLNSLTTYYVYVRAICGENEVSEWSNRASFTTKCATTTVDANNPYTQDFNDETFPPDCWELGGDPFSNWYQTVQGYAYTEYYPNYLYMPFLHIDANNAVLTFKTMEDDIESYTGGSEGEDGLSIVKVSTDGGGTWTQLWCPTINELTTDFRTVTLSLYDYVGQDILIAFEHQGPHGWTIDDVEVKAAPLASFTKEIDPYDEESKQGWYLIASPLDGETDPTAVANLIAEDDSNFALFRFNQDADLEWENYKVHEEGFKLVSGQGYLYANTTGDDLTFTGGGYCGNGKVTLHTTTNAVDFPYMNLIGNPFGTAATLDLPYYRMNENGSALKVTTEDGEVAAMEGVFVYAYDDAEGEPIETATFTEVGRSADASHSIVNLNVEHNRGNVVDNAIIRFDEGRTLPKFTLNEGDTKLYIPQNGKDYAIVRAEASGEMPVNFRAKENGTYSLSFSSENVSFSYLHLIDNMTGADVDLLVPEPAVAERSRSIEGPVSYTFTAKTTDYASRFKLVFVVGSSTGSDAFAFYSNGNWIISNEGQATLQVIDVNGRILSSEAINGSVNKAIHAAPGVYMLRLINGDNVRTQKVVVR